MKKLLSTILAITMMLSISIVLAQEKGIISVKPIIERAVHNVLSTKGEIKEINKGQVRVLGEGTYSEIVLNIQDSTYILDAQDAIKNPFNELEKGDTITAYYGPGVTRSIPPQGNAIALIVGTPETGSAGMYMKVAKVEENKDGSLKVLCTNSDRLVTIRPNIFAQPTDIKEGSELIVWYEMMTMSIPAQATATKVVLLPAKSDIRVHTSAGTIVANGKELPLSVDDRIESNGNTLMLPLRVIAESLGYNVAWDAETKTVELQSGARTMATMTIGSKTYGKFKMAVQLDYAPEIVNGKTLVPVEFFTDLMKLKVEVNNSHI
ncbi:MAG: hypothetical protein K0Q87_5424 [Neobacillus sp.]|jgi:hypothetical protein|nr:hypothetical protein [Neobacillus sp.]